jgi:hypothetical protein
VKHFQKLWLFGLPYNDAENIFPKHSAAWEHFRDSSWTASKYVPQGTIGMILQGYTLLDADGTFGFIELLIADAFVCRIYVRPGRVGNSPDQCLELVEP